MSQIIFPLFALALCFFSCASEPSLEGTPVYFAEVTQRAGLNFAHYNGAQGNYYYPETMGSGTAFFDYDGDGWQDIYLINGAPLSTPSPDPLPTNQLYRNGGDGTFANTTITSGSGDSGYGMGCAAADYDNDGDQDLYLANDFGRNCLYRNDGGRFMDVAAEAGVEDIASGMSVTWGDYNRDGHMDVYVSNMFSTAGNRITFQDQFKPGISIADRASIQRHARGNTLFVNNGNGTFSDVSVESGTTMGRWAWSSLFVDLNNNGWEDIVVANGYMTAPDTNDL